MEYIFLYRILGLQVWLKVAAESTEVALISWVTSAVVAKVVAAVIVVVAATIVIVRSVDPRK